MRRTRLLIAVAYLLASVAGLAAFSRWPATPKFYEPLPADQVQKDPEPRPLRPGSLLTVPRECQHTLRKVQIGDRAGVRLAIYETITESGPEQVAFVFEGLRLRFKYGDQDTITEAFIDKGGGVIQQPVPVTDQ